MLSVIFASLAALIHVYIFVMESVLWGKPRINKVFGVTAAQAEQNRLFAFNQGFYNLFLAIAAGIGVALGLESPVGLTLFVYSLASMMLAAVVLLFSNRKLVKAALIQGLPPFLGLLFLALH